MGIATNRSIRGLVTFAPPLIAVMCLCGAASAQQPARAQTPRAAANPIPVLRAAPASDPSAAARADYAALAKPAAPLTTEAKIKALNPNPPAGGDTVAAKPAPKLTSITLTAQKPIMQDRGYLLFNESRHVDPNENFVIWHHPQNSGMGYVQARLNLEKGKRYLADMSVSCKDPETFQYGLQKVSVPAGSHHLLMILEPEASGWMSLTLSNDNSWGFHSLEVTLQN